MNKNILNIIKTKTTVLFIFLSYQIIVLFFINIMLSKFSEKIFMLSFAAIICVIIDVVFYKMHISRAKYLLNVSPIECLIEDFLLVSYGYDNNHRKDYRLYPIVKANNELFFTYGDYCICHYNQSYSKLNNVYTNIAIFRDDKTKVSIGDKAYLYIKNKIDVSVNIDIDKNTFKLNKQVEHFNNFNKNYDINIIRDLNFFEGIIDIEQMQ